MKKVLFAALAATTLAGSPTLATAGPLSFVEDEVRELGSALEDSVRDPHNVILGAAGPVLQAAHWVVFTVANPVAKQVDGKEIRSRNLSVWRDH